MSEKGFGLLKNQSSLLLFSQRKECTALHFPLRSFHGRGCFLCHTLKKKRDRKSKRRMRNEPMLNVAEGRPGLSLRLAHCYSALEYRSDFWRTLLPVALRASTEQLVAHSKAPVSLAALCTQGQRSCGTQKEAEERQSPASHVTQTGQDLLSGTWLSIFKMHPPLEWSYRNSFMGKCIQQQQMSTNSTPVIGTGWMAERSFLIHGTFLYM